jgi:hypothetical protein
MPPFIVGLLQQDAQASYVLSNVIEFDDENMVWVERRELDFVSKTYVWRCELLGAVKPEVPTDEDQEEGFGMG